MLAYMRVVVVWAVSPIALPSSKDCAYNLPRKALRVKLALPSLQISVARHAIAKPPGRQPHGAVIEPTSAPSAPPPSRPGQTLCTQSYTRKDLRSRHP